MVHSKMRALTDAQTTSPRNREGQVRVVAGLLLGIGVWGTIAPYVGPEVPVPAIVEFMDHVVPGVVVLVLALSSYHRRRFDLLTVGGGFLAAVWMFTTHVPLLAQAVRGEFSWGGSLWMFVPSTLILVLTLWAMVLAWWEEG